MAALRLQLVMAARHGNRDTLRDHLLPHVTPATASGLLDGLVHIVAASGNSEAYRNCVMEISRCAQNNNVTDLLVACNHEGNTPMHCAAGAGNANMVSCLIKLESNRAVAAAPDVAAAAVAAATAAAAAAAVVAAAAPGGAAAAAPGGAAAAAVAAAAAAPVAQAVAAAHEAALQVAVEAQAVDAAQAVLVAKAGAAAQAAAAKAQAATEAATQAAAANAQAATEATTQAAAAKAQAAAEAAAQLTAAQATETKAANTRAMALLVSQAAQAAVEAIHPVPTAAAAHAAATRVVEAAAEAHAVATEPPPTPMAQAAAIEAATAVARAEVTKAAVAAAQAATAAVVAAIQVVAPTAAPMAAAQAASEAATQAAAAADRAVAAAIAATRAIAEAAAQATTNQVLAGVAAQASTIQVAANVRATQVAAASLTAAAVTAVAMAQEEAAMAQATGLAAAAANAAAASANQAAAQAAAAMEQAAAMAAALTQDPVPPEPAVAVAVNQDPAPEDAAAVNEAATAAEAAAATAPAVEAAGAARAAAAMAAQTAAAAAPVVTAAAQAAEAAAAQAAAAAEAAAAAAAAAAIKKLLRMQNKRGETALCQAVRARCMVPVKVLMAVDSELACFPREGEEGASPMYLAVLKGEMGIAWHLFAARYGRLSYSGPGGRNILHEAVSQEALPRVLDWIENHVIVTGAYRTEVINQLTLQRDQNQDGSTPLHLAALRKGSPFLPRKFWSPQVLDNTLRRLLNASPCAAYQPDNNGLYPIHVAFSEVEIKALRRSCPDCATLRDTQGQTFLHVAVDKRRHDVVSYACGDQDLQSILNVQDNDGDTALHGAVSTRNLEAFNHLVRNSLTRLDLSNMKGMTPIDISNFQGLYSIFNPSYIIRDTLLLLEAPSGGRRTDLFIPKQRTIFNMEKETKKITSGVQVMGIMSVLIATVTFAAAFTLPGGLVSDNPTTNPHSYSGTPVLGARGNYAFNAFLIANVLTFMSSTLATFGLFFAGGPQNAVSIRKRYLGISSILLLISARTFVVAFALGLYVVLRPVNQPLVIMVFCVASLYFLCGHLGLWQQIGVAYTVLARCGFSGISAVCRVPCRSIWLAALYCLSMVIIFVLPAFWTNRG